MQILPIDLTALVATILGISIVLIPVIGLTARYALKPTVEALGRLLEHKGLDDTLNLLERRLDLQEQLIRALQENVEDLTEEHRAERPLPGSAPHAALEAGGREPEGRT